MKVILNKDYGGFGFTKEFREFVVEVYNEFYINCEGHLMNDDEDECCTGDAHWRFDKRVIKAFEAFVKLGHNPNSCCAALYVEKVPKNKPFIIQEYDGYETIMFKSDFQWYNTGAKK